MNPLLLLLGAVGGLGLLAMVVAFMPRPERSEEDELLAAAKQDSRRSLPDSLRRITSRIETELRGKPSLLQDARMVGRSLESHVLAKLTGVIVGGALLGGGAFLVGLMGVDLPALISIALAALGALVGWWLPDSFLKSAAEKERKYFQQVTESWLDLAGQLVTAGSDTFAALVTAASYSEQPVFTALRDALRGSAARGEPPWTGLRRLATERRLRFLDPFCASLEMAGTTGAGSRETILTQVEAARSKAMHEADAAAASSGEKMGAPLALIGGAFMMLMGYPPLAGIMDSASVTGGGF
ncbi:MAG: type II secretion system F family protein [bacterium]|nr:type II secretion system F family protein [bacterium]